jgi:outer membrane protein OmpA-like peptidoglycan-associated protein
VKRRLESLSLRWNWALEFLATLPTGDEDSFNRDGDYSLALRLAFSHYIGRENQTQTYGYIGGRYAPGSRLEIDPLYLPFEAEKRLEFGVGIRNQLTKYVGGFADLGGFLAFPFDDGQNPVELSLGFDATLGRAQLWKIYAGLGLEGLAGEEFSNDERYYLGLKRLVGKLKEAQVAKFKKTKYPVYSSSYDILLDSVHSETSVVKKIIGKSHSVYFNSGGAALSPEGELGIIDVVSHLIKYSDKIVEVNIEGFADSDGNKYKNILLSKQRAETVRAALISYGVKPHKLKVVVSGDSKAGVEADAFGKLNNRRAEIYVKNLRVEHLVFPKNEDISLKKRFVKVSKSGGKAQSYARNKLFPKPFLLNGHFVESFTILTEDNLTWGEVSERLYGTSRFHKVLRGLNYNRKPSLGDVVYFPSAKKAKEKAERFYFVRWG